MTKQVIEIHLICRNYLNVEDSSDGYFYSGYWKIAERHAKTAQYLALHESKTHQSYKQGLIEDWELSQERPGRIRFHVKTTDTPYEWVGGGSGEKGYYWSGE